MRIAIVVILLAALGVVGYTQTEATAPTPPGSPSEPAPIIPPPGFIRPASGRSGELGEPKVVKPTAMFSGSHSSIRMKLFTLIHHQRGWKELWEQHRGKDRDPAFTERSQQIDINFESQYVVAVFTGDDSALTVTTFARGDAVLIRVAAHGYQTEGRFPGQKDERSEHQRAKEEAVADYCIVVLPRPVKAVIVEEDVNRRLGEPAIWRERIRFTPPGNNE